MRCSRQHPQWSQHFRHPNSWLDKLWNISLPDSRGHLIYTWDWGNLAKKKQKKLAGQIQWRGENWLLLTDACTMCNGGSKTNLLRTYTNITWSTFTLHYAGGSINHILSRFLFPIVGTLDILRTLTNDRENRQLVTNEPIEFEKWPIELDCRKTTDHFKGIYRIYPNLIEEN
jgi:hypothetical protein